jgi:LuxR family maltose regulon positive regulatory protein
LASALKGNREVELVRTKLEPPLGRHHLIERPRLQEKLNEAANVSLTLILAPAGYGKSSLLSQWFAALKSSSRQVAWLSLEDSDRDSVGLLCYLAAALSAGGSQFAPPIDRVFATEAYTAPEALITALVHCFRQARRPVYLFLDDVHLLSPGPLNTLCRLIDRSPSSVHFIVASRAIPDLHLARTRSRGQLLELHIEDLKFTPAECRTFIASAGEFELDDTDLAALGARTEGWIAGIKLASLALRGQSLPKAILASFTGSRRSVSDFFLEEVFASQPREVRDFLLKTSVLERLCPELCNDLMGNGDSQRLLNLIEESGLFLLRLDDERHWFRYHHLFAEFLHRLLTDESPDDDRELHLRASRWFWAQGSYVDAIEHALKGRDPQRAAELLELRCQDMTYTGKLRLVSTFAEQIPDRILHRYPRVLLSIAWRLTRNLRFEETRKLLATVDDLLIELESSGQIDQQRGLRHLYAHRQMMLAAAQDDAPSVEEQCRHLIQGFPGDRHPFLEGTIYAQMLYAQREQYQLADLERLYAAAQEILARSSSSFAAIALQASVGPSLFFAGRTDDAVRALEQGLAEAIRFGGLNSSLAALPGLPLGELSYESNELERAQQLLDDTLPYATDLGFVDQLMAGFITRARTKRASGDQPAADCALDEAMAIAAERGLERLRLAVVAERVKFLSQDGHAAEAARYAHAAGIPRSPDAVLPKGRMTTLHEFRATAWFRVALSEGRVNEAITVGKHWRAFCTTRGAIRSLVRWDVLCAQALFVNGDSRAAQRTLREAVGHAAGSRLIRSFVDEGPAVRTLIASTFEADFEELNPNAMFAAELLKAFEAGRGKQGTRSPARGTSEGLYGRISVKEREILTLVSSGMRNREVAKKLGMTEGSIKWYMQQVYDKIGTRRRLQAVERARQFGLIA